jgi:uracil-DNA glycosylase
VEAAADNLLNEWEEFFQRARDCEVCQRKFKLPAVNILKEITRPRAAWGLPWYDRYRNLDGGLIVVGKDFGNEKMVSDFRAELARNPRFEPGWDQDRSYFRLRKFLGEMSIACRGFVTNSALCVRPNATKITGNMRSKVYANCLCHLKRQINLVKPYVIAPLGPCARKGCQTANGSAARLAHTASHSPLSQAALAFAV